MCVDAVIPQWTSNSLHWFACQTDNVWQCLCSSFPVPQKLCIFDNFGTMVFAVFMSIWGKIYKSFVRFFFCYGRWSHDYCAAWFSFPANSLCPGCSDVVPGVLETLPGGAGVRVGHCGVSGAGAASSPWVRGQVHLWEEESHHRGKSHTWALFCFIFSHFAANTQSHRLHVVFTKPTKNHIKCLFVM